MITLTKAQRAAAGQIFTRSPILTENGNPVSYKQFRRTFQAMLGSYEKETGHIGVMVHWCGMWLGIETDGYTHS